MTTQPLLAFDRTEARIESARIEQRLVEEKDLPDLLEVHKDDEVTQFLPYETWRTISDARSWHDRVCRLRAEGKSLQFVIVEKSSDRVIGASVLFNVDEVSERTEVGYVLGKAHWGSGLMREALVGLLDFAFDPLKMRRIEAFADPKNTASDRLLRRLGFTCEGTMRQRIAMKGKVRDSSVYGLLRDEWLASAHRREG